MLKLDLIFQATTSRNHYQLLLKKANSHSKEINIGVAFALENGVQLVSDIFIKHKNNCNIFIGINNNVTSYQALCRLFQYGVNVFVVNSDNGIFHSKIYLFEGNDSSFCIVGSANLTKNGLLRNIESSLAITLDNKKNKDLLDKLKGKFNNFKSNRIKNLDVKKIESINDIQELLEKGLLKNESKIIHNSKNSEERKIKTPKMILNNAQSDEENIIAQSDDNVNTELDIVPETLNSDKDKSKEPYDNVETELDTVSETLNSDNGKDEQKEPDDIVSLENDSQYKTKILWQIKISRILILLLLLMSSGYLY